MFLEVKVTRDDIDAGRPGSSMSCPIALAARRAYEAAHGIPAWAFVLPESGDVSSVSVVASKSGAPVYYPESVEELERIIEFTEAFDDREPVDEVIFTFRGSDVYADNAHTA